MKKLISLILTLALSSSLVFSLTACNGGKNENEISVGILQVATHSALDDAREGFEDTLNAWASENGKIIKFDRQNANGDSNNERLFARNLVVKKSDLLLGISTSSSIALANVTTDIPVLFTAVTAPEEEGLIRNNVTGTSDLNPVADQIALIKEIVPECKKIAFIYNSSENNSLMQYRHAEKKCIELGVEIVAKTANQASDIRTVVNSIGNDFDAVYVPTDNLMASNINMICSILHAKGIPTIAGEEGMCEKSGGAVATLGINYYKLGVQTAQMAIAILSGEKTPNQIEFEFYNQDPQFYINEQNALTAGISQTTIDALKERYN